MRKWSLLIALLVVALTGRAAAQEPERSLTAWVDTLTLDYCDQIRSFDSVGVWVATAVDGDTTVGFTIADSVLAVTLLIRWDTANLRLVRPYLRTPVQTLLGRFPNRTQFVDTAAGELYISVAADERLMPVIGPNLPLLYLTGEVKGEGEVLIPRGGIGIDIIEFEGAIDDSLDSKRTLFGFVQVARDTTPEDPGHVIAPDVMLDTMRSAEARVVIRNVAEHGIRRVEAVFSVNTEFARFESVDLERGWPAASWEMQEIVYSTDTIRATFVADTGIDIGDSILLSIRLERTTDSAFVTPITVERFDVDPFPCGYRLEADSGTIFAAKVPEEPDTSDVSVGEQTAPLTIETGNRSLRVESQRLLGEISLYSLQGRLVARENGGALGAHRLVISDIRTQGVYLLSIRMMDGKTWNKRLLIQSN